MCVGPCAYTKTQPTLEKVYAFFRFTDLKRGAPSWDTPKALKQGIFSPLHFIGLKQGIFRLLSFTYIKSGVFRPASFYPLKTGRLRDLRLTDFTPGVIWRVSIYHQKTDARTAAAFYRLRTGHFPAPLFPGISRVSAYSINGQWRYNSLPLLKIYMAAGDIQRRQS